MTRNKKRSIKLGFLVAAAVLFSITAFYHDLSANSEQAYKGLKLFTEVLDEVERNYVDPVDTKELMQKAIQGMVHSLDPHSSFLPPEAFEELQVETKGEFGGIGIVITMRKGRLTVISPIEGTPAYKAGIKAKDIIIKIDGESTKDMMLWETVKKMRGPKGTNLSITIMRKGVTEPINFKLVREDIPLQSVRSICLKPGYGYIWITNFRDNTTPDIKKALKKLESKDTPLKGLVLDLRDNPGGLLDEAINISDLFLEKGTIVSIKGRLKEHTKIFNAHPNKIKRPYPIVVLINGGSASASEIVAGALQDHHRAIILGTTSFGKGSVQTVKSLRDGYGLKFTIARYYTPNGRSIQAQGIEPDIHVKHKIIDDKETDETDDDELKEKDLENHLEAEIDEKEDGDKQTNEKMDIQDKPGVLNLEALMSDSQVKRALDILVSYEILKDLQG
ncbi:MAG: S41 family peptidase [Deltaproteobacteria bacterium]|nr:S41 family peptidase [Deltaproteobacteria bacterium]